MKGVRRGSHGGLDMINQLPDEVLCLIISSLSVDEAVRSSVLSKRWKPLWKHASCLDFDGRHMIKPLSQVENSLSGKVSFDPSKATQQHARRYGKLVYQVLRHHLGDLVSCRFRHFPHSLSIGQVKKWVEFVILKKRLSSLSLECEKLIEKVNHIFLDISQNVKTNFKPRIFSNLYSLELTNYALNSLALSAFETCEKLKILKLKNMLIEDETLNGILENCSCLENFSLIESTGFNKLKILNLTLKFLELQWLTVGEIEVFVENLEVIVLNSLICPIKGLRIFAPKMRSFHSGCNATALRMQANRPNAIVQRVQANQPEQRVLKTQDILENCSDLLGSQTVNTFQNLLTLSIDLDLNNIREALSLSYILRSCLYLENLEITISVDEVSNSNGSSDDCTLPFPNSIFWERQEILYNCINYKLKYATIRGFTGKEQEVKFAKHLITNANMIKRMSIICDSSIVDEATSLQSLPRASVYLSITLKSKINNQLDVVA
ncbi:putative F-box protein [Spatholobus suberectus]|nr:putative F-box protein [Spatholobus suberectus]